MERIHEYQPDALLFVSGDSLTDFNLTVGMNEAGENMHKRNESVVTSVTVPYADCGSLHTNIHIKERNLSLKGFEKVTKKVNEEEAILPKENSDGSYFLYSPKDYICKPGTRTHIYIDIKVRMPSDELFAFNIVHTLTNLSKTGYINSSYYYHERLEGNIHIVLTNNLDHVFTINRGDLLARGKFIKDFTCGYSTSAMGEIF